MLIAVRVSGRNVATINGIHNIIAIGILAVIAGAKGWEDMQNYGISKQEWLGQFLALPNGIPCADTFRRVFNRLAADAFEGCFVNWVRALAGKLGAQVVAIDGKTLRGSYDREQKQSALQLVSAWASEHRLVLTQFKVADKSNEITAIPALLEVLELSGCIITIDAMGTQTEIASRIIDKQADYVLALKANHPTLYQQVKTWFEQAQTQNFLGVEVSFERQVEKGHHRLEIRSCWSVPIAALGKLHQQAQWAGLKSVVMVKRVRNLWNKTTCEVQFYLSSLDSDARVLGRAIRQHWGIENQVHWILDVTFAEDQSRIRAGDAPQNFAVLRRLALNALNRETSYQCSTRQKSNRAAMNNNYMLKILAACLPNAALSSSPASCQ